MVDFAWLMHPLEKKCNDLSKIRKAMGNVFASRKFMQKFKGDSMLSNNTIQPASDDDEEDDGLNEST